MDNPLELILRQVRDKVPKTLRLNDEHWGVILGETAKYTKPLRESGEKKVADQLVSLALDLQRAIGSGTMDVDRITQACFERQELTSSEQVKLEIAFLKAFNDSCVLDKNMVLRGR